MKHCKNCGDGFPEKIFIDKKERNFQNRKYCLKCSPFKSHNTKVLHAEEKDRRKRDSNIEKVLEYRRRNQARAKEFLGNKCTICGYSKCPQALEFHHVDSSTKKFSLSSNMGRKFSDLVDELNKCVLLCANCHREVEYGYITLTSNSVEECSAVTRRVGSSSLP